MTFEEWWKQEDRVYLNEYSTFKMVAAQAWEAGLAEGYDKGFDDTGICPECLNEIRHKMDCGRQR